MSELVDFLIIGGGAAGLGAAQYGARANLKTLVVEEMAHGGQALVIEKLENYPGIPEPVDGYTWAGYMHRQAEDFGAGFLAASVNSIKKENDMFIVDSSEGPLKAKAVLVASGAKHRLLNASGEAEFTGRGVSYCATCDGPFFKGKRMLVVGGGDAACDEAMFLSKLSDDILMIHRRDRFRAQKSIAERVINNPKIKVSWNTVLESIEGKNTVEKVILKNLDSGETREEEVSSVFVFVGTIPQTGFLPKEVKLDEGGYIITDDRMETNISGLFAAGDVRTSPFRQVVTAVSDGAIAAHCVAQYIDEIEGQAYV